MNKEQKELIKEMLERQIDIEEERKGWHNINLVVEIAEELSIELKE